MVVVLAGSAAAQTFEKLAQFPMGATLPQSGFTRGPDGAYYGVTPYGGSNRNGGALFKVVVGTPTTITTLHRFTDQNFGRYPHGPVAIDAQGTVFGATTFGGSQQQKFGTVWKWNANDGFEKLAEFTAATTGSRPASGVRMDGSGALYGTTYTGGMNDDGALWKWSTGDGLVKLADFAAATTGEKPLGAVAIDAATGTIFGTTTAGGMNNAGTVWSWTQAGGLIKRADLDTSVIGSGPPLADVVLDGSGALLGTMVGGDTVWRWTSAGGVVKLADSLNGSGFLGALALDDAGAVYGTAYLAGNFSGGTFWKVSQAGMWSTLGAFDRPVHEFPTGGVVRGTKDFQDNYDFFGTTSQGGANGGGSFWRWNASFPFIEYLADLDGCPLGQGPVGLTMDANGNLYGTTIGGGTTFDSSPPLITDAVTVGSAMPGGGTLWKWNAVDGLTSLTNIGSRTGYRSTHSGLAVDDATGDLFGAATNGNTLWKWTESNGFSDLGTFNASTGNFVQGGPVRDPATGALYGTTSSGGTNSQGTVWRWTQAGGLVALASFASATTGTSPRGSPVWDGQGTLFGTTGSGATNNRGALWKWTSAGGLVKLADFDGIGFGANSGVAIATDGTVYGTTASGGATANGTLWKWSTMGGLVKLADFSTAVGSLPRGGVVLADDGNLYGTASFGGANSLGTIWKWNATDGLVVIRHLTTDDGIGPVPERLLLDGNLLFGTAESTVWQVDLSGPPAPTPTTTPGGTTATPTPTLTAVPGTPTATATNVPGESCMGCCENCVDDDGDTLIDRSDPECEGRAHGGVSGLGDPKGRGKNAVACAKALGKAVTGFVQKKQKTLASCVQKIEACVQLKDADAECLAKAKGGCDKGIAKIGGLETKLVQTVTGKCGAAAIAFDDLLAATGLGFDAEAGPCAMVQVPSLASASDVALCLMRRAECAVERLIGVEAPRTRELLELAGVDATRFTCLAPEADGGGAGLQDPDGRGKALVKCHKGLQKAGGAFAVGRAKQLGACVAAVLACVQQKPDDDACLPKARGKCAKIETKLDGLAAKMRAAVAKACVVDVADMLADAGLGHEAAETLCGGLGVTSLTTVADVAECLVRHHACRTLQVFEAGTPRAHELLQAGGIP